MGLSRNKVAVSEGAAGSPPFYGESGRALRRSSIFGNRFNQLTRVFEHKLNTPLAVQFLRIIPQSKTLYGGVAQLGEHLPCKQGVMGSIPIISTSDCVAANHRSKKAKRERSRPAIGKSAGGEVPRDDTNQNHRK